MKRRMMIFMLAALAIGFCAPAVVSAQMLDMDANPPVIASSGSFETTYQTRMDFSISGGMLSNADWTISQSYAGYKVTGASQAGEAIGLAMTGTQSPVPDTNPSASLVFNSLTMTLTFRDGDQNVLGEPVHYSSGNVKDSPLSYQLDDVIPAGARSAVIMGVFKCRWATSVVAEETVSVTVELEIEEDPAVVVPIETANEPAIAPENTESTTPATSEPEQIPVASDEVETNRDPGRHAGPLTTALIAVIAAVMAVLAGGVGQGSGPADQDALDREARDPAYEKSKIPEYPGYVVGRDGEHLTKMQNGNIEITYPTGERAVYFPNGDLDQMKTPDGSTWAWRSDGTLAEKKPDGSTVIRNEEMDVLSWVSPSSMIYTRHPEDPDAYVVSSPYGGSVVIKTKSEYVTLPNSEGKLQQELIERQVLEGKIQTEDMTYIYKPDGSVEAEGDDGSQFTSDSEGNSQWRGPDGSTYEEYADGRVNYQGADGTSLSGNLQTGEVECRTPDGSYIRGNSLSGELDARMPDGSFWKRDAAGSASFVDQKAGTKGVCESDGSASVENDSASSTQHADGTLEFKTKSGVVVTEKPDGTVSTQLPDGRSSLDTPDGTKTINMPDGTIFRTSPDGQTQIARPDGSILNTAPDEHNRELARYNDWYNKLLEQQLNNGQE